MRAALALLLLAGVSLSGCDGVTDGSTTTTRNCPEWTPGGGSAYIFDQAFGGLREDNAGNDTFPAAPSAMQLDGHPIDIFDLDFGLFDRRAGNDAAGVNVTDGRVTLRFFRGDTHEALVAYDITKGTPGSKNAGQYEWSFGPGRHDAFLLEVKLSRPPGPSSPTQLRIEYAFLPDLDQNGNTPSEAVVAFIGKFQYRVC
jgi:hypothetical protein